MKHLAIALVGWLGFISLSSADTPTDPGHVFIPVGSMFPSYSSWAISVTLNVAPYQNKLKSLSMAQDGIQSLIEKLERQNLSLALKARTSDLREAHSQQIEVATGLRRSFNDLLYPNDPTFNMATVRTKRVKRAWFNGFGNMMSYLFGTATESEIQHLAKNIELLNQKDVVLAHRFNGTLTVLNATRIGMIQNRHALRSLQNATDSLTDAYKDMRAAIRNMSLKVNLLDCIVTLTEATMRVTQQLQFLFSELNTLSQKVAFAQTGLLHKRLMSRRTFRRLLNKIAKDLPRTLALPFPSENVNEYIRTVRTKVIEAKNRYHILFYIPLIHNQHRFKVYRFFPYQVPMHDHNVSLTYFPDEPRYLMMSDRQQSYIQPSDSEIESCLLARQPFCSLHEPAYEAASSTSCVVALYRRDATASRRYCSPRLLPTNSAPKAYYLTGGRWLIVSRPPVTLTILCLSTETSHTITLNRPVETITLQPECSASGDTFYLPPYYASETHLNLPSDLIDSSYTNVSLPIWRDEWSSKLNNSQSGSQSQSGSHTSILPEIHVDGVPADTYFDHIMSQPLEKVSSESRQFSTSMTLIIIIGILSVVCLIFIIRHCCPRQPLTFRFRSNPAAIPDPEPAIAMQESVSVVAPRPQPRPQSGSPHDRYVSGSPDDRDVSGPSEGRCARHSPQLPADQDVTPVRGDTPFMPAHVAPTLAGPRPTPRLTPLV